MTREQQAMIAAATFVTTYDDMKMPVPENMLYLAFENQGIPGLSMIQFLKMADIAKDVGNHFLTIGEKGKEILETLKKARAEGKINF